MREQFVDENGRDVRRRVNVPGRTIHDAAGTPAFLVAPGLPGRGLVDGDQRETQPVRDRIPGTVIGEFQYLFARGVLQTDCLTAVVERACVLPGDIEPGPVPGRKRGRVFNHQHGGARQEIRHGAAGEIEINSAGQADAAQVQRLGPDVLQLDILKLLDVVRITRKRCGMVHDFGNAQVPLRE